MKSNKYYVIMKELRHKETYDLLEKPEIYAIFNKEKEAKEYFEYLKDFVKKYPTKYNYFMPEAEYLSPDDIKDKIFIYR